MPHELGAGLVGCWDDAVADVFEEVGGGGKLKGVDGGGDKMGIRDGYGTVEVIANVVHFLCGDESTYVNGQELAVDGGFCAAGIGLPSLRSDRDS